MMQFVSAHTHLARAREFQKMTGKGQSLNFLNDFHDYLGTAKGKCVGFPHDVASIVGDDFLSNLDVIIFPFSSK